MMPRSREGTKDFKMSLAVVLLPGLSLGSTYLLRVLCVTPLKESAVFCAKEIKMDKALDQYSQFIHLSRYARWNESKKRRETWEETVERYISFFTNKFR